MEINDALNTKLAVTVAGSIEWGRKDAKMSPFGVCSLQKPKSELTHFSQSFVLNALARLPWLLVVTVDARMYSLCTRTWTLPVFIQYSTGTLTTKKKKTEHYQRGKCSQFFYVRSN